MVPGYWPPFSFYGDFDFMKLDPVFTVKENKLFLIDGTTAVNTASLKKIEVRWSVVELEDEAYNEEYLASLRDELKILDESGRYAVLVPVVDKPLETAEQIELFINAYNHTARRVKDCISVAGMELPDSLIEAGSSAVEEFIETLGKKHAQYVYFSKSNKLNDSAIVLY